MADGISSTNNNSVNDSVSKTQDVQNNGLNNQNETVQKTTTTEVPTNFSPTAFQERQLVNTGHIRQANLQSQRLSPTGFDYNQIAGVRNNPNVTDEFLRGVESMSARLGAKPEHILAAMSFETGGTFSPRIQNSIGATGLIQFIPDTARGLGTTTNALRQMSAVEQLKYVEKYFEPFKGNLDTLEKVYTSILSGSPKANPNDVLFRQGTRAYEQNPLDWNRDGVITAQEATTPVTARMFGGTTAVQQRLLDGGYVPNNQRAGFADGFWGRNTAAAVANFQRANGLPVTGNLDETTGRRLFNLSATPPNNPPTTPAPSTGILPNAGIVRGNQGAEVEKLQNLLVRFGDLTAAQKATGPGIFGPQTQAALQDFQRNLGINPTGNFDNQTRTAMQEVLGGVRKGERSALVERIQDRLVQLGFMTANQKATGPGIFGDRTFNALRNFQSRNGLDDDGIFGPLTYKALFNGTSRPTNGGTTTPNTRLYDVNQGILISNELAPKLNRLAQEYTNRTGSRLRVTSGFRPPSRQADAMADLIETRGRTYVRNLYRDKTSVNEIISAYDRGGRDEMTRVIQNQVNNGRYISDHLRSDAVDLSINTNERVLREIVAQLGGRVLNEGNHFHIELS